MKSTNSHHLQQYVNKHIANWTGDKQRVFNLECVIIKCFTQAVQYPNTGTHTALGINEDYGMLGFQERDVESNYHLLGKEEEENMYHVLENPGDDDYEDPNKETGVEMVGGVTEYEVPVQLKKSNI